MNAETHGMVMSMDDLLAALRAAGEPTRLRILLALRETELNVGELCTVLEQSQPRVSRHLKLLVEAGLVSRTTEGTSAYFRLTDDAATRRLIDAMFERVDHDADDVVADRAAIDTVRAEREAIARHYFDEIAADWDRIRPMHVADEDVEAALLTVVQGRDVDLLVDIGTGTGRILELFAPHVERAIGIDTSISMLRGARAHLDGPGFEHCTVRLSDATDLDIATASADLVVLHHMLHFVEDPQAVLREVARITGPGGIVVIVDFAQHHVEALRRDYSHRHLGFSTNHLAELGRGVGLHVESIDVFVPDTTGPSLAVHLWQATPLADHQPTPIGSPS